MNGLWSKEEVDEFISQHRIDTKGSINTHQLTVEEIYDGDVYTRVSMEFWYQNDSVVIGVLGFAKDAAERGAHVHIHHPPSSFYAIVRVCFFHSVCDPD